MSSPFLKNISSVRDFLKVLVQVFLLAEEPEN
jgi:hypothetical protein